MLVELRPGLWRWTARHPEWTPPVKAGGPDDWPPDVGCVAYRASGAFVFIDPLVPEAERERFWAAADELVGRHGRPVHVVTTLAFHPRSRDEVAARYGARTSRARASLPAGVEPIRIRGAGETMFWIAEHRALVPGDRLLGDGRGGLRPCPDSWLRYLPNPIGGRELRAALAPLLDLPAELVLVSHGDPVLSGGRVAIERALT